MHELTLDSDPTSALEQIVAASRERPVVIFKRSPICPVSHRAEAEFDAWLDSLEASAEVSVARVNVITERTLARGLTAALDVRHESPQALWFQAGALAWHESHDALVADRFRLALADATDA